MSKAYYNEHDPKSAAWLRELIKQGHIAPGDVDERSIEDVLPSELAGYTQCHFFAGIGVWSYALRQAGWPDDRPVWTGSCPCQPFSAAGKRGGTSDERHLWPAFHWLISQRKPDVVFGEQVASKDGLAWLDTVQSDMEAAGYTFGAVDLCAAGIGAPHIRQRLYFVAESLSQQEQSTTAGRFHAESGERSTVDQLADAPIERYDGRRSGEAINGPSEFERSRNAGILEHAESDGRDARRAEPDRRRVASGCGIDLLGDAEGSERRISVREGQIDSVESGGASSTRILDFPISAGSQGHCRDERDGSESGRDGESEAGSITPPGATNGFWRDAEWIYCRDSKWRAAEPGVSPLAHGATARVGRLRGYGNAIVAPVAEAFIRAYMGR